MGRDRSAATVVLVSLLLLGCGGGETLPERTTADDGPPPVVVVGDEYSYRPATLSAPRPLRVRLDNVGALAHTWTVLAERVEDEVDVRPELVLVEARAEPGQSAIVDLSALAPGAYQIVCTIPGHISSGMVGELIVEP